ncbi:hypothetical protein K474DRAFT_786286 [Panus rudis PR-1116 ss-1]|nr:hypothetical protein K474DRAFT_786286 [Panus rudis PR-1116 ss-1]
MQSVRSLKAATRSIGISTPCHRRHFGRRCALAHGLMHLGLTRMPRRRFSHTSHALCAQARSVAIHLRSLFSLKLYLSSSTAIFIIPNAYAIHVSTLMNPMYTECL